MEGILSKDHCVPSDQAGQRQNTTPVNLYQLLEQAAADPADNGISFYGPGDVENIEQRITYSSLLQNAQNNAALLARGTYLRIPNCSSRTVRQTARHRIESFTKETSLTIQRFPDSGDVDSEIVSSQTQRRLYLSSPFRQPQRWSRVVLVGYCCGVHAGYLYALRQRSWAKEETDSTPEGFAQRPGDSHYRETCPRIPRIRRPASRENRGHSTSTCKFFQHSRLVTACRLLKEYRDYCRLDAYIWEFWKRQSCLPSTRPIATVSQWQVKAP